MFFSDGSSLVSPIDGNLTGIDERSNLTVKFTQTMNVESINFNAVDSIVRDPYNILLSYDSNFQNTIPLSTDFTSSNNDTVFEFQPAILSNTNLQLTQNKNLYAKVTQTAKNLGDMNLASEFAPTNYANTVAGEDFKAIDASVFTSNGEEVELGLGTSGAAANMPSQSLIISKTTPIVIHFNEVPALNDSGNLYALGSGEMIQLSTQYDFSSGQVSTTDTTVTRTGLYGTQLQVHLGAALTASTRYYLRILKQDDMTLDMKNEGGVIMSAIVYFNSFTTTA